MKAKVGERLEDAMLLALTVERCGHEPRCAGSLQEPDRGRKQTLPKSFQKGCGDPLILGVLTAGIVR